MQVKLVSVRRDETVYLVDNRRVVMPTGTERPPHELDNVTLIFYPHQSYYEDTGDDAGTAERQALIDYLAAETVADVKYRIVPANPS